MNRFVIIVGCAVLLFGCYRMFNAERIVVDVLENKGYQNVRIVDHAWFGFTHGCWGKSRYFKAIAENKSGRDVQVSICYSLWTRINELPEDK